jgi:hypothetical protein
LCAVGCRVACRRTTTWSTIHTRVNRATVDHHARLVRAHNPTTQSTPLHATGNLLSEKTRRCRDGHGFVQEGAKGSAAVLSPHKQTPPHVGLKRLPQCCCFGRVNFIRNYQSTADMIRICQKCAQFEYEPPLCMAKQASFLTSSARQLVAHAPQSHDVHTIVS